MWRTWAWREECQEVKKVIKYISEKKEELLAVMDRKKRLLKEAPEDFRNQIFQDVRALDEIISKEDTELLETRRIGEKQRQSGEREGEK